MNSENNELIFTHDYITQENSHDNEYGLIIYASKRAKDLRVGMRTYLKTNTPDKDKDSCIALREILHGHIPADMNYKDNSTLDNTFMDSTDSDQFSLLDEESDTYDSDTDTDDDEGYLSALNSTVE